MSLATLEADQPVLADAQGKLLDQPQELVEIEVEGKQHKVTLAMHAAIQFRLQRGYTVRSVDGNGTFSYDQGENMGLVQPLTARRATQWE